MRATAGPNVKAGAAGKRAFRGASHIIDAVQGTQPSLKFKAALIRRDKQQEHHMMDSRVKRLELDQRRAMDWLQKTLDTHQKADQIRQRRVSDLEFKNSWLTY